MGGYFPDAKRDNHGTPEKLFADLHHEFRFTVDLAAEDGNALLKRYYTKENDSLVKDWRGENGYCNPPYDTKSITAFVKKAHETWSESPGVGVFLLPAKTDQKWWHDYVWQKERVEVRFLRGRLKFKGEKNGATFASCVVVFYGKRNDI